MRYELPVNHNLSEYVTGKRELLPRGEGDAPCITDIQYMSLESGVASEESLLISAPTSTGKTLIGWWAIASCLLSGGRAVYLVSHRALAKQKFEEAQRLFLTDMFRNDPTAIICATGDSVEDASGRKTNSPLGGLLLIATYEKFLGSLSVGGPPANLTDTTFVCDEVQLIGDANRGQSVELLLTLIKRAGWKQFVGLSAVLSQRDSEALADWLDLNLVRNSTREKAIYIECRLPEQTLSIEVTPDYSGEIQNFVGDRTRGTLEIVGEQLQNPAYVPVIVFCMRVADTYELCSQWIRGKAPSEHVELPPSFEVEDALVEALRRRAAFHNAELSDEERSLIEVRIADEQIDVIFATTTLAAGVNFPLGSAVFDRWRRWNFDKRRHDPIDKAEFQNMVGRVGRMGQAAEQGTAILSAEPLDERVVRNLINLDEQEEMSSGISPEDFGCLVLQLFAGKLCNNCQSAFDILATTLSASREAENGVGDVEHWREPLEEQITRLITEQCLVGNGRQITATGYGLAVARSGLKPETAKYLLENLAERAERLVGLLPNAGEIGDEDQLLFVLSHAALTSPEYTREGGKQTRNVNYRMENDNITLSSDFARNAGDLLFSLPLNSDPKAANASLHIVKWAVGARRKTLTNLIDGVRQGVVEAISRDVAWILQGISEVLQYATSVNMADDERPLSLSNNPNVSVSPRLPCGREQKTGF